MPDTQLISYRKLSHQLVGELVAGFPDSRILVYRTLNRGLLLRVTSKTRKASHAFLFDLRLFLGNLGLLVSTIVGGERAQHSKKDGQHGADGGGSCFNGMPQVGRSTDRLQVSSPMMSLTGHATLATPWHGLLACAAGCHRHSVSGTQCLRGVALINMVLQRRLVRRQVPTEPRCHPSTHRIPPGSLSRLVDFRVTCVVWPQRPHAVE